tara:strand:+ start:6318 stop:7889 length:1572 start_codon:yes stop_codon:yes gene_type:complete
MAEPKIQNNINILDNPHSFPASDLEISCDFTKTVLDKVLIAIGKGGDVGKILIEKILEKYTDYDLNDIGNYWTYPLHYAIIMREEDIALFLIEKGADINALDEYGMSPLNYTVTKFRYKHSCTKMRVNKELVKLLTTLVVMGADVTHINPHNDLYPHTDSVRSGYYYSYERIKSRINTVLKLNLESPSKLEKLRARLDSEEYNGNIIQDIIDSFSKKSEDVILSKIDKAFKKVGDAIIHMHDDQGQTMLHYAVYFEMKRVLEKLVFLGVDPSRRNKIGWTAFDISSKLETLEKQQDMANFFVDCLNRYNKLKQSKNQNKEAEFSDSSLESPKSDSAKTDSESISDDDFLDHNSNVKPSKKSKKKILKLKREKEKKELKKIKEKAREQIHNELVLMRTEDIRQIEINRKERFNKLLDFLNDRLKTYNLMYFFTSIKNYSADSKNKRIEEERKNRILAKSLKKRLQKGFKKLVNAKQLIDKDKLKSSFCFLRKNALFKRRYIGDRLFFFEFELYDSNLSKRYVFV